jgi:hypothetical protein
MGVTLEMETSIFPECSKTGPPQHGVITQAVNTCVYEAITLALRCIGFSK